MNIIMRVVPSWIFWISFYVLCIVSGFMFGDSLRLTHEAKNECTTSYNAHSVITIQSSIT